MIAAVLEALVEEHGIASASATVRVEGREVFHRTVGLARREPPRKAAEDQPYDLASLTKPLVGAALTAALGVAPDLRVAEVLPDVDPRITVGHLLTHASGYPAWRPLYEEVSDAWGLAGTRAHLLGVARRTPLVHPPGEVHVYSDLGFLVLTSLLEALGGARLDVLFREHVQGDVEDLAWGWPGAAATERCPVRGAVVEGMVHDLNAAALGGVSAHAGLFGTARAVARLAERLVPFPLWDVRGPGTHRGGWDTPSTGYTSTGAHFPPESFGHLGYTGTSLWAVPSRRTVVVLLTNRIHPTDDLAAIRLGRPLFHDAVARALGWTG